MSEVKTVYKILDTKTGLYSRGGSGNRKRWSNQGKTWSSIGSLKNHLRLVNENRFADKYSKTCKIVCYEVIVSESEKSKQLDFDLSYGKKL